MYLKCLASPLPLPPPQGGCHLKGTSNAIWRARAEQLQLTFDIIHYSGWSVCIKGSAVHLLAHQIQGVLAVNSCRSPVFLVDLCCFVCNQPTRVTVCSISRWSLVSRRCNFTLCVKHNLSIYQAAFRTKQSTSDHLSSIKAPTDIHIRANKSTLSSAL